MKFPLLALLVTLTAAFAQAPALSPLPPDGFVTLSQIVSDFATQPDAALQKYQGQSLLVYGRVGQVTQSDDAQGDPFTVFLQVSEQQTTPDVKCVFGISAIPEGDQNAEAQVTDDDREVVVAHRGADGNIRWQRPMFVTGRMVGIRGTFDNFVAGDAVLKDCRKIPGKKLANILQKHGIATE